MVNRQANSAKNNYSAFARRNAAGFRWAPPARTGGVKRSRRKRHGQALVPVLFVMVILTFVAVGFGTSAAREVRAARNYIAQTKRIEAARGAVMYAMSALTTTSYSGATYGIVPTGTDTDANGWQQIGDAYVKIQVTDTAGLLNLNTVTLATLQQFPVLVNNPTPPAALIDWRTAGETASTNGAKSSYYNTLNPPYNCKDAPYDTVDELLLVDGWTPDMLYGTISGNQVSNQPNETTTAAAATTTGGAGAAGGAAATSAATSATTAMQTAIFQASTMPFAEMLTTESRERQVSTDGTQRTNINTAAATDIQTNLGISAQLAQRIVQFRQQSTTGGARTGIGAVTSGAGQRATRQAKPGGAATTAKPGATTPGGTAGAASAATAAASGQTFKTIADLLAVPGFTRTVMESIADRIAVDSNTYHLNVVNLNTAPAEVLATVTGMDQNTLNDIIQYRQAGNAFQSLNDYFALQTIQGSGSTSARAVFQNTIGGLCTKSSIYRIRVLVKTSGQQGLYAVQAIVQMSDTGPSVLDWHEVPRSPGWSTWLPPPTLPPATVQAIGATSSGGS